MPVSGSFSIDAILGNKLRQEQVQEDVSSRASSPEIRESPSPRSSPGLPESPPHRALHGPPKGWNPVGMGSVPLLMAPGQYPLPSPYPLPTRGPGMYHPGMMTIQGRIPGSAFQPTQAGPVSPSLSDMQYWQLLQARAAGFLPRIYDHPGTEKGF